MKTAAPNGSQGVGVAVVVAAVVAVLGLKAALPGVHSAKPVSAVSSPDALPATTPGLAEAVGRPAQSSTAVEPYPREPMKQVDWVLAHRRAALVLFHSTLCRACRMMDALVQMVRPDYEPQVVFIDVSVDQPANEEVIRWANVGSIPAFYFLTPNGDEKRIVGLMTQAELREEMATLTVDSQDNQDLPALAPT